MNNLAWAQELVAAPDLEAAGSIISRRLTAYTAVGAPPSERALAERLAFEHQVRHYMARANERGFAFTHAFEDFAGRWIDFVNQNKSTEGELAQFGRRQEYERGRADATTTVAQGWVPTASLQPVPIPSTVPVAPVALSDAVHQTIDAIVKAAINKHTAGRAATAPLQSAEEAGAAPLAPALDAARPRLSESLKIYLAPLGKKRARKTRGRAEEDHQFGGLFAAIIDVFSLRQTDAFLLWR